MRRLRGHEVLNSARRTPSSTNRGLGVASNGAVHGLDGVADAARRPSAGHTPASRLLSASDPRPAFEDVGEGLTAVVSVKLDAPEFYGATRTRLGGDGDAVHPDVRDTGAVHACVRDAVQAHLGTWLERHPDQAAAVIARIVESPRQA
ncbi:hypothetical protein ACFXAW_01130 [Streptomyces sp. NPDC059445]|uniref:hypothetical protein n=1 Tax=Streptomyces sp. NPDC059445 TaxID=3346832 RepID=UPI00367A332A